MTPAPGSSRVLPAVALAALHALAPLVASAQMTASPSPAPSPAASPAAPSSARVADLSWIAGRWVDDTKGNYSEEIWTGPGGGAMVGMWRYLTGGRVQLYELLSLSDEGGGVVLRLRHFDPQLVAREEKDAPVTLRLTGLQGARATFEGQGSTGPLRLTYHRTGSRTLTSTLERGGTKQEFHFVRRDATSASAPAGAARPSPGTMRPPSPSPATSPAP